MAPVVCVSPRRWRGSGTLFMFGHSFLAFSHQEAGEDRVLKPRI